MTYWLPVLVPLVAMAGWWWPRLSPRAGRMVAWGVMVVATGAAATAPWHPIARMVMICCVLLAGMKGIVYVEWCAGGRRRLGFGRYFAFALLWFGMDPGAFARRVERLDWRRHFQVGLACVAGGTLAALAVRTLEWTWIVAVFVPMSIGFHFGALQILTAGWRRGGFPVRTLFRNPLGSRSLADFWANRWNLGYAQMMARVVKRPLEPMIGARLAGMAVFLVSGLLHELAITVPVGAGYGLPTAYFGLQALAVRIEAATPAGGWRRAWAILLVVAPLPLLFPPGFQDEVILPCLRLLPDLGTL